MTVNMRLKSMFVELATVQGELGQTKMRYKSAKSDRPAPLFVNCFHTIPFFFNDGFSYWH